MDEGLDSIDKIVINRRNIHNGSYEIVEISSPLVKESLS